MNEQKVTDYNIVIAKSPEALTKAVQISIAMGGWQPIGGPVLISSTLGPVLMQALVKIEASSSVLTATAQVMCQ
jgi:hypothetical protein